MKRYDLIVSGDVQGVFYRHHALKKAKELGINGWIKNEADGTVTIVAEGEEDILKDFVNWAWEGSPMSDVEDVSFEVTEGTGEFKNFEIL